MGGRAALVLGATGGQIVSFEHASAAWLVVLVCVSEKQLNILLEIGQSELILQLQ